MGGTINSAKLADGRTRWSTPTLRRSALPGFAATDIEAPPRLVNHAGRQCFVVNDVVAEKRLEDVVPDELLRNVAADDRRALPGLAKNPSALAALHDLVASLPSRHELRVGDARDLNGIPDRSVHLVITSPPYWILKEYPERGGQLGNLSDYSHFLDELEQVWREVLRVLVPGGRLVVVVGDVCLPRRKFGRHVVVPLHAGIQERCRGIGFDNLAPIVWYKIANAVYEATGNGHGFLGKPYEPNAVVKNDIEYILFQRKPGGYRQPGMAARVLSVIAADDYREWFKQVWTLPGASTREHPAPFPLTLAERLVRMFSFVGDTVLDPFAGTGTTNLAAARWGRNSIGIEIESSYFELACNRLSAFAVRERGTEVA